MKTGDPAPLPAPAADVQFTLTFAYGPDVTPFGLLPNPQTPTPVPPRVTLLSPLFSGLVPGYVGLYQINFKVPAPPGAVSTCFNLYNGTASGDPGVNSNLTVSVIGISSFDGAGICVSTSGSAVTTNSSTVRQPASRPQSVPSFLPNTIWFPPGANTGNAGQPVPQRPTR